MTEKIDTQTKIELFKIAAELTKLAFENQELPSATTKAINSLKRMSSDKETNAEHSSEEPTVLDFFQNTLLEVQQSFHDMN